MSFIRDDKWQKMMRDRILVPHLYNKWRRKLGGQYLLLDEGFMADALQPLGVDTLMVQSKGDRQVSTVHTVDEKIVRWPKERIRKWPERRAGNGEYTAVVLETKSRTIPDEKPGWMVYGKNSRLLYCLSNEHETQLRCLMIDFQPLKTWFWAELEKNDTVFNEGTAKNEPGSPRVRLVEIEDIDRAGFLLWDRTLPEVVDD